MIRFVSFVCAALVLSVLPISADDDHGGRLSARLHPEQEVPVVSSPARGRFSASVDRHLQEVEYTLSFSGLQATVTQAHIHLAQPGVNGGIMVWLCGSATNPGPAGTQLCPQSGEVTGIIRPADVLATGNPPGSQGITAGEFDEFVAMLRKGFGYANVHTAQSPGGEIRGQIRGSDRD